MKPNLVRIAAEADMALATIAAVGTAAMDAGLNLAGNKQQQYAVLVLRDDVIHPGRPHCSFPSPRGLEDTLSKRNWYEIKRTCRRRTGDAEAGSRLGERELGHRGFSD